MKATIRKWPEVDIIKIYTKSSLVEWNNFLTLCYNRQDLLCLEKTYYGLQVGMDNIVKRKLNNEKISNLFIRLTRSIEITVKRIYRNKFPNKLDDPITAKKMMIDRPMEYKELLKEKRQRDGMFEAWLRRVSF